VTTGISAADRAKTIAVAINPDSTRDDITTPGHVFPLVAREGGTLVRAGHTEASVDIARKAGLNPSAVICEIMNDDGTMARLPDLVSFAQKHNLKLGTIADLIAHRRLTERLVRQVEEGTFKHAVGGDWRAIVFANTVEYQEHLALVKGDISDGSPVMVRMHAVDLLDDMTGQPHWINIHNSMRMISDAGKGAIVMIREHRRTALAERVRLLASQPRPQRELRDYGIGAQILLDLGVKNMILLTNQRRTVIGLDGYGLNIVEQRRIPNIVGGGYEV
jgi:3,4-dihydroxy 2-butanone 4-phosphate synthase/GTP cyclohydrolase II